MQAVLAFAFRYMPIMGTPTDGMKVRFFEDYLNVLPLEASQPIPIGDVDNVGR